MSSRAASTTDVHWLLAKAMEESEKKTGQIGGAAAAASTAVCTTVVPRSENAVKGEIPTGAEGWLHGAAPSW